MRKSKDMYPAVGQGCKQHHVAVGMFHKRDFCMCTAHSWLELNRCEGCCELFHVKRKDAKTCSDKCRKRLSRKKRASKDKRVIFIKTKAGRVEQEVFW